jgi:hypothetical protein
MRIPLITGLMICAVLAPLFPADGLDSELMKELLSEQKFDAGLTNTGTSGLLLTARTKSMHTGSWFMGLTGFLDRTTLAEDDEPDHDFGFMFSMSAGIWDDVFGAGWIRDVELSFNVPVYFQDISADSRWGSGDASVTLKGKLVEYDPVRPDIPAVSLIVSGYLPTGFEEFSLIDTAGAEAGVIFGSKVPDSANQVLFDVYLEFRLAVIDYIDTGTDSFVKSNFGVSFPMLEIPNADLNLEYQKITANDNFENGSIYSASIRHKSEERNITVGFKLRGYDDQDKVERRIFLMYDHKF